MADSMHLNRSSTSLNPRAINSEEDSKRSSVAANCLSWKTLECITLKKEGILGGRFVHDIGLFLLTTATLEVVRRFSRAKCPFVWRGLQALQFLCYPPFKWIQRWAPFKPLVKHMQTLSKPMLALTIATVFSDESEFADETYNRSDDSCVYVEPSSELASQDQSKVPEDHSSERWLVNLRKELEKQSITVPERLNDDELRRFYAAANGDFSRLLSSVKKTIRWRQTYTIFSPEELEAWSNLVFWHGCDFELNPCLIIRLGQACSNLRPNDRPLFVKAVVSQMEHGVMSMVDKENPQIMVLMDCKGLSPFGFPVQTMRACAILLQDHFPNCLSCLIIIRLPPVARVITQTLFQVLRPATKKKLRIIGGKHQEILSTYLQTLPVFLGGRCSCPKCLGPINSPGLTAATANENISLSDSDNGNIDGDKEVILRAAIIVGVVMLWAFILFVLAMHPEKFHLLIGS